MTFTQYLKSQLVDFVDTYKKFYTKTLSTTIVFTLITFVLIALLLHFSIFDKTSSKRHMSLLSYFFVRYSEGETYSIVDLSKTVFILMVSVFSLSFTRLKNEKPETAEFNFFDFFKKIKPEDLGYLLIALIISIPADYLLFKLDDTATPIYRVSLSGKWIHSMLFFLRIYIPLIAFSVANYNTLTNKKIRLTFKKLLSLFIILWLFNEFAFEISSFVRAHIFELLLLPFPEDKHYLIESILGVPLISFYFLGYYSAMVHSMKLLYDTPEEDEMDAA
jgi:hypothetical protein